MAAIIIVLKGESLLMTEKNAGGSTFKSNGINSKLMPYYLMLPSLIIVLGLILFPIINVFYYSFQSYNPARPYMNGYIGFDNYVKIFTQDMFFYKSLAISLKWVLVQVSLQLSIGLMVALVLNTKFRGRGFARGVTFAPWALSGVIVAILWSLMFNENIGIINDIFERLGIISKPVAWLASPNTAFGAVSVAELWRGMPFFAISLLASLQAIPDELYESCGMDGGGRLVQFRYITLPFLKDTIVLTTLLRAVWEFNAVDIIMNSTGGGPMGLTSTLSIYLADQAIKTRNFGYGSAIGVVSFMIMLVFAVGYLRLSKFGGEK